MVTMLKVELGDKHFGREGHLIRNKIDDIRFSVDSTFHGGLWEHNGQLFVIKHDPQLGSIYQQVVAREEKLV